MDAQWHEERSKGIGGSEAFLSRFMRFFIIGPPDECWEWNGAIKNNGYGVIGLGGRSDGVGSAHRISYQVFIGKIPDGLHILHKCDNRKCVNPNHLYAGTRSDNIKDAYNRKRREPIFANAKLAKDDVIAIRNSSEDKHLLANLYNVDESTIRSIRSGKTWRGI